MRRNTAIPTILLVGSACLGCSDGRPSRVPISGQVLIDGQPLKYGAIRFIPKGARPSTGTLDQEGRFTLACFDTSDGAVMGAHRVEIAACEERSATSTFWHAPKKYADVTTSGITKDVLESTDTMIIELSWEGGKPFLEKESDGDSESHLKLLHGGSK